MKNIGRNFKTKLHMGEIGEIVDSCHIGDSNRSVIERVVSRLEGKRRTFFQMPKAERRVFMQTIICFHSDNRAEHRNAMLTHRLTARHKKGGLS